MAIDRRWHIASTVTPAGHIIDVIQRWKQLMSEIDVAPTLRPTVAEGMAIDVQVRLLLATDIAMGPGKADLLVAIRETGSISAAGRRLGMSYKRAWLLVETMNQCFQSPLVTANKGGSGGGGARITELGETVLAEYRLMQEAIDRVVAAHLPRLARHGRMLG